MLDAEELHLPDLELQIPANRTRWFSLLYAKHWILYAKRPFGGPKQVLSYLANYTHRVRAEQPPYPRRRCAASERHLHLSRLPAWLTQRKDLTLSALGVHPALQLAYPASGTGAYPTLWNTGQ
jgi:Putative transposase